MFDTFPFRFGRILRFFFVVASFFFTCSICRKKAAELQMRATFFYDVVDWFKLKKLLI